MGLLDIFSSSPANDAKRGKDALLYYHNRALAYPENYSYTYDELIAKLQSMSNGQFLDGLGFGISSASMYDSDVRKGMEALADKGKGKLPARWADFFSALVEPARTVHFLDAAAAVTTGSLKSIGDGLVEVGDTVTGTLKNAASLVTFVPYVAFIGLGFWVYLMAKKKAA